MNGIGDDMTAKIFSEKKTVFLSLLRSAWYGPIPVNRMDSHRVLFVHRLSGLSMCVLAIFAVVALRRSNWIDVAIFLLTSAAFLAIYLLNFYRQSKFLGGILIAFMLSNVTISFIIGPNITRVGALMCYSGFIVISAMILTKRVFYIFLACTIVIISILSILAAQGMLGVRFGVGIHEQQMIASIFLIITIGILARGVLNSILENEEQFRRVFHDSSDPVLLSNESGFFDGNRAALEALKIGSLKDLVGKQIWDISPPFQREGHSSIDRGSAITSAISNGGHSLFEWTLQRADKSLFDVEVSLSKSTLNGKPIHISVWRDVTQRRRSEAETLTASYELMRLTRLHHMGELTASMAHELNQPLTAILNNAQRGLLTIESGRAHMGEMKELLEDIARDDKRAGKIIKSLRSMTKPGTIKGEELNINEVLGEVVSLFKGEAIIRDIKIELQLAPLLPVLVMDRVQLQQLLINLITNAAESMSDISGQRRIIIKSAGDNGPDSKTILVSVTDFGTGVPEENLNKVFEPFFTTKETGMGVGLTLARSVVEAYGGMIKVENNAGRGTTLSFALPVGGNGR